MSVLQRPSLNWNLYGHDWSLFTYKCTGTGSQWHYSPPGSNTQLSQLSRHEVSPEDGAATLAAHLGLTETGFSFIASEKCARATDELRELWSALMPDEFEDYGHPILCVYFVPSTSRRWWLRTRPSPIRMARTMPCLWRFPRASTLPNFCAPPSVPTCTRST
ncbi:hypothetical protein C8R47DRAFT_1158638 [Mycena vitilis]|nr:hypothetical protein C8R47DRAFT_1158638 [Mycena vitilis]